ncbi:RHS repeat-associated core domain-containing protein [bacterium]|nr:RHS repeat-associated core domain-containing protein [bacterium]
MGPTGTDWYLHDGLGSVRLTLDDAGVPVDPSGYSYTPFGIPQSGAIAEPFGFTGEVHSIETGLVYLRARWYDPASGTFLSRDPFAGYPTIPYSQHPYQYGYSNPARWTDPSGLCPIPPMEGDGICVDFFIADKGIGPSVTLPLTAGPHSTLVTQHVGVGDNRGANAASVPGEEVLSGGSRAYLYIVVDECGQVIDEDLTINTSYILGGLWGFREPQYDIFKSQQAGNEIYVEWSLLNGVSGWARENRDTALDLGRRGSDVAHLGAAFWQAVEYAATLDEIDGHMRLGLNETTGRFEITYLFRDPYPSMEVWFYRNQKVEYLIDFRPQTPAGPEIGLRQQGGDRVP